MQTELTQGAMFTKALNAKARSVDAVLSSEAIDGHGEIIDQASWQLARYRQNPIVLHMHSHYSVIGRAENIQIVAGKLEARIVFATTPLAEEVWTLFRDGAMRAFSVGFRAGRVAREILDGRTIRKLFDCQLMEVSAVSVPSNAECVVRHKSLGLVPASYQIGDGSEELLRSLHEAVHGVDETVPTGDAGDDYMRSARALSTRDLRVIDGGNERDPFDFGGAA